MPINLGNLAKSIGQELIANNNNFISEFIKDLEEKLNNMDKQSIEYTIDRFEGEFAVCENRETNEMININKKDLPQEAKEGSIIKFENNKYSLDVEKEEEISERIKQKMDNLWNN